MTFNWDSICDSLKGYNDVNLSQLTCYIDELYDKVADLESRLSRQEEYQQEQNDY